MRPTLHRLDARPPPATHELKKPLAGITVRQLNQVLAYQISAGRQWPHLLRNHRPFAAQITALRVTLTTQEQAAAAQGSEALRQREGIKGADRGEGPLYSHAVAERATTEAAIAKVERELAEAKARANVIESQRSALRVEHTRQAASVQASPADAGSIFVSI